MFRRLLGGLLAATTLAFSVSTLAAVDANKASQAELETVKGIGPAMSTRILDERKKGPYKSWDDLVERVKGIGDGNAGKFAAGGLTVNGGAYKGTALAAATKPPSTPVAEAKPAPKK